MKISTQTLVLLASSLSLITINFSNSQSAQASVVCKSGTINSYPDGSLESCILAQKITVQVSSNLATSNFYCQARNSISFDSKGQFHSCQLSKEILIRQGNSIETCPAESRVYVSISDEGAQSITCRR